MEGGRDGGGKKYSEGREWERNECQIKCSQLERRSR